MTRNFDNILNYLEFCEEVFNQFDLWELHCKSSQMRLLKVNKGEERGAANVLASYRLNMGKIMIW